MRRARQIFEEAMKLYGAVNAQGEIDQARAAVYEARALTALNLMQRDIFALENPTKEAGGSVPEDLRSLNDLVHVSQESAARCMPYGLVMSFAELDRDAFLYNTYAAEYQGRLAAVRRPKETIRNVRGRWR